MTCRDTTGSAEFSPVTPLLWCIRHVTTVHLFCEVTWLCLAGIIEDGSALPFGSWQKGMNARWIMKFHTKGGLPNPKPERRRPQRLPGGKLMLSKHHIVFTLGITLVDLRLFRKILHLNASFLSCGSSLSIDINQLKLQLSGVVIKLRETESCRMSEFNFEDCVKFNTSFTVLRLQLQS
ncbi:hypothetical protein J6590_045748 [Homalodisca vitripennis]|nr:hypothetical protein J6590_045748 [Homalodisca vitripennis]